MKVLVVGQGGREDAILWKVAGSPKVKALYAAPGNGGTRERAINVPIKPDDVKGLADFAVNEKIGLTIVGPEAALAGGIVDLFEKKGLKIFGPTRAASSLEASKIFMKQLALSENIPTAWFEIFSDVKKAKDFIRSKTPPVVIKTDGLASGKGVVVANSADEALKAVDIMMVEKRFGPSGEKIIVEECLTGEEASIIVVSDGDNIVPLASSQDHKRIFDKDEGPNTGGMGAYSPADVVTDEIFETTISKIIKPAISGMKARHIPFKGVLYAGIMITKEGPKLLEFNARFGDPETQAILPRLDSDLVELIDLSVCGSLKGYCPEWKKKHSVCIVIASGGYPGKYEKGKEITGLEKARELRDVMVFHAGTKTEERASGNVILTDGGRVLSVVSLGDDIKNAIERAYKACGLIEFENIYYRKDIGHRALNRTVCVTGAEYKKEQK